MSDLEFLVLDELYFVISYPELQSACDCSKAELLTTLEALKKKGWLRVYNAPDEELAFAEIDLKNHYKTYLYLASKSGLHAHNEL